MKENPLVTILLGLLVAAIGIMTFLQGNYQRNQEIQQSQLWTKLDRITNLMMAEREIIRQDMKDLARAQQCDAKDVVLLREKIEKLAQYHPVPINGNGGKTK